MENNVYECPIWENGKEIGRLYAQPEGAYQCLRAQCRSSQKGILRLVARCGEKHIPLGVLTPWEDCQSLRRKLSGAERRRLGLTQAEACYVTAEAAARWEAADRGWELFSERELRDCCCRVSGMKQRQEGENTYLAVPLRTPFPLMPIFCLASYMELDGCPYLVFCFRGGALIPCELDKNAGNREALSAHTMGGVPIE